jgi:hypothetical protein
VGRHWWTGNAYSAHARLHGVENEQLLTSILSVAIFCARLDDDESILQCFHDSSQLALDILPLCFRGRNTSNNPRAPPRWPSCLYHHLLCPAARRELDSLWRHEGKVLWRSHVWSNPHGLCATLCAECANEVLGYLVYQ